jgi:uncharacterized protein YbcV (DUF1398 family)
VDAALIAVARKCLSAAFEKTMSFHAIVAALIDAGFEGYIVDYRRNTTTYFLPEGDSVVLDNPPSATRVAAAFDQAGLQAQIRWAQANTPDYSFAAFGENVKALGCAGYIVSFSGRRVLYFGRTAETHVEHFPQ